MIALVRHTYTVTIRGRQKWQGFGILCHKRQNQCSTQTKQICRFRLCCQATPTHSITRVRYNQMTDAHKEEESVQLLGEEPRAGAQAQNLKLG